MAADIRKYPVLMQTLAGTRRLIRVLWWVLLGLFWLTVVGLIGAGCYLRWSLGVTEYNVAWVLACFLGLVGVQIHLFCGLWPFSLLPWFRTDACKETSE